MHPARRATVPAWRASDNRPERPEPPGRPPPRPRAFSMRRALPPSRSETRLDNLMWASSNNASNRFCNWTRFRLCWYLARVSVRHRRCSGSGTKLSVSSWATQTPDQTLGVGEIVLAPPSRAVRLRLRQVQCSGHRRGTFPLLADPPPLPFQGSPGRSPNTAPSIP
jgi:hypothetical protein